MTVTSQPRTESSHAAVSPNTPAPTMTIERVSAMIDHDHRPVFPDLLTELEPVHRRRARQTQCLLTGDQKLKKFGIIIFTEQQPPDLLTFCSNALRSVDRRS